MVLPVVGTREDPRPARVGPRRSKSEKAPRVVALGWTWESTTPGENTHGPGYVLAKPTNDVQHDPLISKWKSRLSPSLKPTYVGKGPSKWSLLPAQSEISVPRF